MNDDGGDVADGIIRVANPALENLLRVRREKIIGRLAREVRGLPDLIKPLHERFGRVAWQGRSALLEIEMREPGKYSALSAGSPGGGMVAVSSSDIFDVAEARRDARAGTSLGLVSMEGRVALLDGVLEIASEPGSGTVVRARFASFNAAASAGRDPSEAGS